VVVLFVCEEEKEVFEGIAILDELLVMNVFVLLLMPVVDVVAETKAGMIVIDNEPNVIINILVVLSITKKVKLLRI
jgi:hypothetical protein